MTGTSHGARSARVRSGQTPGSGYAIVGPNASVRPGAGTTGQPAAGDLTRHPVATKNDPALGYCRDSGLAIWPSTQEMTAQTPFRVGVLRFSSD